MCQLSVPKVKVTRRQEAPEMAHIKRRCLLRLAALRASQGTHPAQRLAKQCKCTFS